MSSFIPLADAIKMNADYRQNREEILKPEYQDQNILCICETFEKSQVDDLLSKEGCAGLRVYYGMDEEMKVHALLVAVDENNADMIPSGSARSSEEAGDQDVLERAQRCPEECPPASPLNQP